MRSTATRRGKENGAPAGSDGGGASRESPESRRLAAYQERADQSPAVQLLTQLQARMNGSAQASSAVVQRVDDITLTGGKKPRTFNVAKAAEIAKNNLEEEYDDVSEEDIEQALRAHVGQSSFASMDEFVNLVKTLLPPRLGGVVGSDEEESDPEEAEALFDEKAITGAVRATLGGENAELEQFYISRLTGLVQRMNEGAVAVRWLTLNGEQKAEVLTRLIQAMVSLGIAKGDPETFFSSATTILHGSYLFGAAGERPADVDVIVEGSGEKNIGLAGHLSREPKADMTVGSKAGLVDYMVGIPFSETEPADLASDSPTELRDAAIEDLTTYFRAAIDEDDPGKQWRKLANISVAVDYLLQRFDIDSGLREYIAEANQAIVGGAPPKVDQAFVKAVDRGLKVLAKAEEPETNAEEI